MRRQNIFLTAWLIAPLLVLVVIIWGVVLSLRHPPEKMKAVGAGAGTTGSDNSAFRVFGTHHEAQAPAAQPEASGSARMVQPETLPQGYILIVEDKSGRATVDSPIYVAGSFNNWNPGDAAFKLTPQSDMRWRVQMPASKDGKPVEFKFTRGTWELEELNPDMTKTKNRTLGPVDVSKLNSDESPRIELAVAHWGDERPEYASAKAADPYLPLSTTGKVSRLEVTGGAGSARGTTRELLVWLPPGYDAPENAGVRYPVLYMHDGQNLFAKHGGIPAEWGLDETAQSLVSKGRTRPFIIVGVPHSGGGRMREYVSGRFMDGVEPDGEAHLAWLREEVMPRVERAFRVATGAESTGIGGASLGAAISVSAAAAHPEVFGLLYCESLSFGADRAEWMSLLEGWKTLPRRVYIGVGGREVPGDEATSARMVANAREIERRCEAAGLGADRLLTIVDAQAEHNEQAWAARAERALRFLFPPPLDSTK